MFGDNGNISATEQAYRVAGGEGCIVSRDAAGVQQATSQASRIGSEISAALFSRVYTSVEAAVSRIGHGKDIELAIIGIDIDAVARLQLQCGGDGGRDMDTSVSAESDVRTACCRYELFHGANINRDNVWCMITLERQTVAYQCLQAISESAAEDSHRPVRPVPPTAPLNIFELQCRGGDYGGISGAIYAVREQSYKHAAEDMQVAVGGCKPIK